MLVTILTPYQEGESESFYIANFYIAVVILVGIFTWIKLFLRSHEESTVFLMLQLFESKAKLVFVSYQERKGKRGNLLILNDID
jgi:hypothetical protein